tara:strand:+ start:4578 stop:5102 length:525 start_codon:yes stop_codon:yes gene_type:complete
MASPQVALMGAQVALQGLSTIFGARGVAKAAKAEIRGNTESIRLLNESIGDLANVGQSRKEAAQYESAFQFDVAGGQTSNMYDDLFKQYENNMGSQGFAFSGELKQQNLLAGERIGEQFLDKKMAIDMALSKQISGIADWESGEQARLQSEKRKLEARNRVLRTQNTTWKALGF